MVRGWCSTQLLWDESRLWFRDSVACSFLPCLDDIWVFEPQDADCCNCLKVGGEVVVRLAVPPHETHVARKVDLHSLRDGTDTVRRGDSGNAG